MQEQPILNFRPEERTDFEFLGVPESGFIPFIALVCALTAGAIWFWCIRRRQS
jgi:hypothetical protein